MKKLPLRSLVGALVGLGLSFPALTDPLLQLPTGRYTQQPAAPTFPQRYPLAAIVTPRFNNNVATVGDAIQTVLHGSGYAQIHRRNEPYSLALMKKPLPDVHRRIGPMPLSLALQTLAGTPYDVLVNDVTREVCIELGAHANVSPAPSASNANLTRLNTLERLRASQASLARQTAAIPSARPNATAIPTVAGMPSAFAQRLQPTRRSPFGWKRLPVTSPSVTTAQPSATAPFTRATNAVSTAQTESPQAPAAAQRRVAKLAPTVSVRWNRFSRR